MQACVHPTAAVCLRIMAIFGSVTTVWEQCAAGPDLRAALDYVGRMLRPGSAERARIDALAAGETKRVELGRGMYAMESAYLTKARADGFFESHRKFIDVQAVIEGEELMEVAEISRLTVAEPFNAEKDFIKYADFAGASVLRVPAGFVAVYFPVDGHMPSLAVGGPRLVRKTVVKVPVA
jgi:YhcH/YjgK/YiaL family protein